MDLVAARPDEALLLDLLNTTPVVDGRHGRAGGPQGGAGLAARGAIAPPGRNGGAGGGAVSAAECRSRRDGPSALQSVPRASLAASRRRPRWAGLGTVRSTEAQRGGPGGHGVGRAAGLKPRPAAALRQH